MVFSKPAGFEKPVHNKVSGGEIQGRMTKAENSAFVKTQRGYHPMKTPGGGNCGGSHHEKPA
jgi:hypothetical protein